MKLTFYNNKDTTNTINKDLTELSTIDINFKQGQNMYTPSLMLTKLNVPPLSNYAKLAEKFYFINSTYEYHTEYLIINLIEDVLGWVAVLVVSVVMHFVDWPILDPLLSVGFTLFILFNVLRNLKTTAQLFFQATPDKKLLADIFLAKRPIAII